MEALASVVFERTPQGAVAMKSPTDEVPRRLRTLLLAIDGRSPVAQYVLFLSAFAPLSEKFAELENMGLIRRSSGKAADSVLPSSTPPTLTPPNLKLPEPGFMPVKEFDLQALAGVSSSAQTPVAVNDFERELQVLASQMSLNAAAPALPPGGKPAASMPGWLRAGAGTEPAPGPAVKADTGLGAQIQPPLESAGLADLLREMDRFVYQYAGTDALPISLMLEQIKTLAQLRSELPQYAQLVQRYGPSAGPHIERLSALVSQAQG